MHLLSIILLTEDVLPHFVFLKSSCRYYCIALPIAHPILRHLSTTIVVCPSIFLLSEDMHRVGPFVSSKVAVYFPILFILVSNITGAKTTDRTVNHVLAPRYRHTRTYVNTTSYMLFFGALRVYFLISCRWDPKRKTTKYLVKQLRQTPPSVVNTIKVA